MLDIYEQQKWFQAFLEASSKHPEACKDTVKALMWARAMSEIAEQFVDNDDDDDAYAIGE